MADVVDSETRSRMMSGIRGKDTKPEILIRKGLFSKGFRFRLHRKDLPGKPDLVLPKYNAVIFVHGCFWHGHDCHLFKWPSTRPDFWKSKISRNKEVDRYNLKKLRNLDWRVLEIWECSLKGRGKIPFEILVNRTESWLKSSSRKKTIRGKKVLGRGNDRK